MNVRFPPIADTRQLSQSAGSENRANSIRRFEAVGTSQYRELAIAAHSRGTAFNLAWWVLVVTNAVLMHAVWVSQLTRGSWNAIDWATFKWPLIACGVLGNFSYFMWEKQLLSAF
jgi:hypothetical protein